MRTSPIPLHSLAAALLLTVSPGILSQENEQKGVFRPEEGMEGKNAPYFTTPPELIEKMLGLARITPEDFLIDLGSGDGRMVIAAAKKGARALGIEYNPDLVRLAASNAQDQGVSHLVKFVEADFFEFDFSGATIITLFLLPEINVKLRPRLLALKPGTRIVSNTFPMQEWHYDEVARTGDEHNRWNTAYLWIVPASVGGTWVLDRGSEMSIRQEYQSFTGSMTAGGDRFAITRGRIRGNEIAFSANGIVYTARVNGSTMKGTFASEGEEHSWIATHQKN